MSESEVFEAVGEEEEEEGWGWEWGGWKGAKRWEAPERLMNP